jgi:hypothetical protein
MKNKIFLARVRKKQNVAINTPASNGGQGKYMHPLKAALSIANFI